MKIAIVGAGIIGLYLSRKLAEKRNVVFVFEKKKEVGKKVCSGLFSERIFNFFPEAEDCVENEIKFCLIHFPKKTIKIEFSKKFFVFDRLKLEQLAFKLAKKSGAKIILGDEIKEVPGGFDRIIGTDGANSTIRKILNLKNPEFFLAIQGFEENLNKNLVNYVETWPTKEGFLWKIPRKKFIEWGVMEKPKLAKMIFENFIKNKNIKLIGINSASIPQGFILPKNEKITLCGDSTGLTKPWSGGGVIWGLTSAEILLKNFPNFSDYEKEIKKFFLKQILFSKFVKKMVYFLGFKFPFLLPKNFKIDGDFLI